jgi:hypothetical protein
VGQTIGFCRLSACWVGQTIGFCRLSACFAEARQATEDDGLSHLAWQRL